MFIKQKKQIYEININELEAFLYKKGRSFFDKPENHVLLEKDFIEFDIYTNNNKLIRFNDYCMCDIQNGELWICQHTPKQRKLTNGRKTYLYPLLYVCNMLLTFGQNYNGVWGIPDISGNKIRS